MGQARQLKIDPSEVFPNLPNAAITEAVIEIRARAGVPWNEPEIREKLKPLMVGYPEQISGRAMMFQVTPGANKELAAQDLGWNGVWFKTADQKQIAKFQLDLFSFSRLHPYKDWDQFIGEATRLWKIHSGIARPSDVLRLGIRFINRFPIPAGRVEVSDYFIGFPDDLPEMNLTLGGFLHHDVFVIPNQPYGVNLIKTVQPADAPNKEFGLILDIDVYTTTPFANEINLIEEKLKEMRWLKNKVFFKTITKKLKGSLLK
jgi:uncharacterized protein (TIGR04255 family)